MLNGRSVINQPPSSVMNLPKIQARSASEWISSVKRSFSHQPAPIVSDEPPENTSSKRKRVDHLSRLSILQFKIHSLALRAGNSSLGVRKRVKSNVKSNGSWVKSNGSNLFVFPICCEIKWVKPLCFSHLLATAALLVAHAVALWTRGPIAVRSIQPSLHPQVVPHAGRSCEST